MTIKKASSTPLLSNYRLWLILGLLATAGVAWLAGTWAGYRALERQSFEESFRYSQLLGNELDRYRPIPELMAEHPRMTEALESPGDDALLLRANEEMKRMATIVDSSDVYLMDASGLTIAASNYELETSFVGGNFSFRPYFYEAMEAGESAVYFALGTTSLERGLYFSHPVQPSNGGGDPLGVIVVKILVTDLESQWQRPLDYYGAEMVVQDSDGISFLSSRPEWLYRSFQPLTEDVLNSVIDSQRYARQPIEAMDITREGRPLGVSDQSQRVMINEDGVEHNYLSVLTPLPELDWDLRVLVSTQPVLTSQIQFLVAGTLMFMGLTLAWLYLRERYRREAELAERGEQLEHRVAERTADLESSNRQLLGVIRERERAQEELKEAQRELIQAAKLAVLGQMSAGLNHEMNQPLTAIRAYTSNSQRFLARGEHDMVEANLQEIDQLCQRMSDLTRQFKVFARKSEGNPSSVDLRQPIEAALKIVQAQTHDSHIEIVWQPPADPVWVHGDLIRIEQVLVNLINNAMQAVEQTHRARIDIQLEQGDEEWICRVMDNGPGLPADTAQLFEPFYTTKSIKQGLGLGLSISRQIVDALGGRLTGRNRADRSGAEFILVLRQRSTQTAPEPSHDESIQ